MKRFTVVVIISFWRVIVVQRHDRTGGVVVGDDHRTPPLRTALAYRKALHSTTVGQKTKKPSSFTFKFTTIFIVTLQSLCIRIYDIHIRTEEND